MRISDWSSDVCSSDLEALFTLGDRPEARYAAARDALTQSGHDSTLSYLGAMARDVLEETGLLPHLNPGLMGAENYAALRPYAARSAHDTVGKGVGSTVSTRVDAYR